MPLDRREFVRSTCVVGGGLALGAGSLHGASADSGHREARPILGPVSDPPQVSPKRLLILGGTGFIGPSMVRYAVDRGHEVTIFTRGRSLADIPDVEQLTGDRNDDLTALAGRSWDAILDNNARDYRWVELSTSELKDAAEHYVFVSSISAYSVATLDLEGVSFPLQSPIVDEDSPLFSLPDEFQPGEEAPYGLSKTRGEHAAETAFPGRATVIRPGLIVGPGDPTDRFTYWPVRMDRGGEILAPSAGNDPTQIIDVRDLTEWIIRLAEEGVTGRFNATGPGTRLSMSEMLSGIRAITASPVSLTWVPFPFLREHGVQPWSDMPAWIPDDPISFVSVQRGVAQGLTFRPLAETAMDTLQFHMARPAERRNDMQAGISPERERAVLEAWHSRQE